MLFKMMGFIVRLAPLGVLGAIAFTVGKYGVGSLAQLGMLVLIFYLVLHRLRAAACSAPIMRLAGFSIFKFIALHPRGAADRARHGLLRRVLPQIMRKLEGMGVGESTVGLVIPTGYSFNLDGFSIYLTLAAVFIAQATNTPLTRLRPADHPRRVAASPPRAPTASRARRSSCWRRRSPRSRPCRSIGLVLVLAVDWFMGIAPRAQQHDRQLRGDGRDRRLGGRHRPGRERSRCSTATTRPRICLPSRWSSVRARVAADRGI